MTATDELRRMLTEAGVEWGNIRNDGSESDYLTEWQFEGIQSYAVATEWAVGGGLSLETHRYHLTPAQAIETTVGRGTCCAYETESMSCSCNDVQLYNGKWVTGLSLTVHVMKCSACGGTYEYVNGGYEYCPRCGRKVVDE